LKCTETGWQSNAAGSGCRGLAAFLTPTSTSPPMRAAGKARRSIVELGMSVRDRVLESLTPSYSTLVEQVRSIVRTYKNNFEALVSSISSVRGLDLLIAYIMLVSALSARRALGGEELARLAASFEKHVYDAFSASRVRRAMEEAGFDRDASNSAIFATARALNIITRKYKSPQLWIVRQKRISEFEESIRRALFRGLGGSGVRRGVKLFLRLFIHDTNIPLAFRIAYGQECKKYILHGDIYTALVTLRSGAFEDVMTSTSERARARIARRLVCEVRGGSKCRENVVMRLESVRGLVRYVGKISGDPVLYERGAHEIGYRYCRALRCDECALRGVCRRYTFVIVK